MAQFAFPAETDRAPARLPGDPQILDKLRELVRSGYVADPEPRSDTGGILMRHQAAPDLVLMPDGSIDLPLEQAPKAAPAEPASAEAKRVRWRRVFLVLFAGLSFWFLSLMLMVAILSE